MEKLLLEACLELILHHSDSLVGIQDMGAAGLVSSSAEMASKAGSGLILTLDEVPQRETGMTPYEMMLSESQERMLICVKPGEEEKIQELFQKYDLDAVTIGKVTDDGQYRLYHQGKEVANLPVDALAEDAPVYHKEMKEPARIADFQRLAPYQPVIEEPGQVLLDLLQQPTIASKRSIYETYDSQVQTNTVVCPGSDAAVMRVRGTNKALAMTTDCNARYLYLDPKVGGQIAVAEAARNIIASGGRPLAITDCLNYGSPDKPEVFWELSTSADGIAAACETLGTPVISGNVSLYNETDGQAIYPTPMIGMVGLIEDHEHITTQEFKKSGDLIYILGKTFADFDGSELQKMQLGRIEGVIRNFDLAVEKKNQELVLTAIQNGLIESAHDCSEGGLAIALAESAFKYQLGLSVQFGLPSAQLFAETQSRFVLTVAPENQTRFEEMMGDAAVLAGKVTDEAIIEISATDGQIKIETAVARKCWEDAIVCLMK